MHDQINQAKKIQSELYTLREQLSRLTTPTLSDTENLSSIYQSIIDLPNIDKRELYHYFIVIAVYLYSPISLFGQFPIKAGLCGKMGEIIGRCRQEVSEIFAEAKFRYENIPSFREQIEQIFTQIEK